MRIVVYVGNGEYVDTIDIEDDASDFDIADIATEVAFDWVENTVHWELEEE